MCFVTKKNQFKIAEKPIRVYKLLYKSGRSPMRYYAYHKGLNVPESAIIENIQKASGYCYFEGVLHCFKNKCETKYYRVITMYVPIGAQYNDEGYDRSSNEVISTALYWPKNRVERIWYYLISKKY